MKRLEKLHWPRRVPPLIIYAIMADEAPGPITGFTTLDRTVDRLYGEDHWPAFAERARAACGGPRIMCATYAPEPAPAAAPQPSATVLADTNPQPFPWHRSGIGVTDERYLHWHPANASMIADDSD
jgi:hypothetical protein